MQYDKTELSYDVDFLLMDIYSQKQKIDPVILCSLTVWLLSFLALNISRIVWCFDLFFTTSYHHDRNVLKNF